MIYKHGAYGEIANTPVKVTAQSNCIPAYVGTAPVQNTKGGAANVNKPVLISSMTEAKALFGYNEDWNKYTLCEPMYAHFSAAGIGPIVLINVFDVTANKADTETSESIAPVNGVITIAEATDIILDTVTVTGKELGVDYTIAYDSDNRTIVIKEVVADGLGATALAIKYFKTDVTKVTNVQVAGTTDGAGINTGVYTVADVNQECGILPYVVLAPGFSHDSTVRQAMLEVSTDLNKHWNIMFYTDIPLNSGGTNTTLATAKTWKDTNGYNADNEKVFYPMWKGSDGKKYHLSVLYMVNKQNIDGINDNIPYESASNTAVAIQGKLYFGENLNIIASDENINENLNKNGITSAAYIGNQWVLWGAHTASYTFDTATNGNIFETNIQMLQYVSNDFQIRRAEDIDKVIERNRMEQIAAEEQAKLDALVSTGALLYGKIVYTGDKELTGDMLSGDIVFKFEITTSPLIKSLTGIVSYTPEGLKVLYGGGVE